MTKKIFPKIKPTTQILLAILVFSLSVFGVWKIYNWKTIDSGKSGVKTFNSSLARFSVDLPSTMTMVETPERAEDGFVKGEVWFTFETHNENEPRGLVVVYGKPSIDGKGGACVDNEGNDGFTKEIIAGQDVSVCSAGPGFRVGYFSHPTDAIEYWIDTARLTVDELAIIKQAVRTSFRFNEGTISIVTNNYQSPNGGYTMRVGPAGELTLIDRKGRVILSDYTFDFVSLPGYNQNWFCQCGGPNFVGWSSEESFVIEMRAQDKQGELLVYHMEVSALTGKINVNSFQLVPNSD
jgi:hypothetical protein